MLTLLPDSGLEACKHKSIIVHNAIHTVWQKSEPQTILDKNVKSQHIVKTLHALDSEYIFNELQNFTGKYSLTVELLIFKYQQQNISVSANS